MNMENRERSLLYMKARTRKCFVSRGYMFVGGSCFRIHITAGCPRGQDPILQVLCSSLLDSHNRFVFGLFMFGIAQEKLKVHGIDFAR